MNKEYKNDSICKYRNTMGFLKYYIQLNFYKVTLFFLANTSIHVTTSLKDPIFLKIDFSNWKFIFFMLFNETCTNLNINLNVIFKRVN